MSTIHILQENPEWTAPLVAELEALDLPHEVWQLDRGLLDLAEAPPQGVFYNRMSASSHTRGHRYAPEYTAAVLAWLERHGRRVLNPRRALELELSKVAQYQALDRQGIPTPRTVATVGRQQLLAAARRFDGPFISKHNRAGKGLGVQLFQNAAELERQLQGDGLSTSVDGITLLQDYIRAPEPCITRVEFIGREFLYAVRVDTSEGFELCPADVCTVDGEFCPTSGGDKFRIIEGFDHSLLERYRRFLHAEGVDVAAFEFIVNEAGRAYTYDINTNTNYNAVAETRAGISGMAALARHLGSELARLEESASAPA
ncbi:MAG: hypothetical protein R3202_11135 [Candidatus Competibacterales bacterium]|nr:hypothetical protein [Candidatus Competibacterales bacterium]